MTAVITGVSILLAMVSAVLVLSQVDALAVTGMGLTSGPLQQFFSTPPFIVLLIVAFVGVGGLLAVVKRFTSG
tara:strand:+ start:3037 stop:3255 length:219 start_codon:yes stop_codon:yes gene_type:complete